MFLSFPHADQGWLAWISMIPGFIAICGTGTKKGFWLGWLFGSLFYGFITSWFGIFGWEPLVVGSLFFGLYFAIFFIVYGYYTEKSAPASQWQRFLIAPMLWAAVEWLKAQGIFGFPWGDLGITQYKFQALLQTASVFGVYGISFVVVFVNNLIAETILAIAAFGNETGIKPWKEFPKPAFWSGAANLFKMLTAEKGENITLRTAWIASALLIPAILISGQLMVPMQVKVGDYESVCNGKVKVGITQINMNQYEKWHPKNLNKSLKLLEEGTKELVKNQAQVVIWPETAIPQTNPLNNYSLREFLTRIPVQNKVELIAGIVDKNSGNFFNTVIHINQEGEVVSKYNKIQLVPLGEYFPFPAFLKKYKIFDRIGNYTHGTELKIFDTPYGKFQPLICFESFFPYLARKGVAQGTQILVVQTNDSWFHRSNAAKIHYINGMFRAVENRVWLVQCANSGVSGVIDPWGRSLMETELFVQTNISCDIYPYNSPRTLYNRWGNIFPVTAGLAAIILLLLPVLRSNRKGNNKPDSKLQTQDKTKEKDKAETK